jgi:hypothetical protein
LLQRRDRLLIAATMWDTRSHVAQQPFGLKIVGLLVIPTPVNSCRSRAVPRIEGISTVLSQLLLGSETVAEFVEHQIGIDQRDAAHQNYERPFLASALFALDDPER